jgi:DNA-binding transcriptional LysR family regulator
MEIDSLGNGLRGTLRMGMVSSSATGHITRKMAEFRELYPEVSFQIYEGNTYQLLEGLKANQIDLALVRAPFPEMGFVCHKYQEEYFVAAGLPGSLPEGAGLEAVSECPLILYRRWEKPIRRAFENRGLPLRLACMVDNAWTSVEMVRSGMGIALLPESFARDIQGIHSWDIGEETLKTQLMLVKRDDRYISNITKIFFEKFEV